MTSDDEYYPSPFDILSRLGMECVLVGSATKKPIYSCKDIDFVISDKGQTILSEYDYWLDIWNDGWKTWIPFHDEGLQKCIDFFHDICDIEDRSKWDSRLTYDQAILLPTKIIVVDQVELLSLV